MADARVSNFENGLNHLSSSFSEITSTTVARERVFLWLNQLDALIQIGVQGDLSQHSEQRLYHYFAVMSDYVSALKAVCEWLVSRAESAASASSA